MSLARSTILLATISLSNVVFPVPGGPFTEKTGASPSCLIAILTATCCINAGIYLAGHLPLGEFVTLRVLSKNRFISLFPASGEMIVLGKLSRPFDFPYPARMYSITFFSYSFPSPKFPF